MLVESDDHDGATQRWRTQADADDRDAAKSDRPVSTTLGDEVSVALLGRSDYRQHGR